MWRAGALPGRSSGICVGFAVASVPSRRYCIYVGVQGASADSDLAGDGCDGGVRQQGARRGDLLRGHHGGPASGPAAGPGDGQALARAFGDELAAPTPSDEYSLTAGPVGPNLLQDAYLIEKLAHFVRERVPDRVYHVKGGGAFGYFEVTADVTQWTKAAFLSQVGKRTPMLARFSTVAGEEGYPDTDRDVRGFALKFYTEEGNYDLVGNNTPVFSCATP
jgi:hypothetical protein